MKTCSLIRAMSVIFACVLTVGSAAAATLIHVPADQPTIQAGINAAINGDTVLVAPGTYIENINFMGKAITVKSSNGPKVTIIDGNAAAPVAAFVTSEGPKSVLTGFTLQNGVGTFAFGYQGGGISINNASPTIKQNVIKSNTAGDGGGVGVNFGSPIISGNTITGNSAQFGGGWHSLAPPVRRCSTILLPGIRRDLELPLSCSPPRTYLLKTIEFSAMVPLDKEADYTSSTRPMRSLCRTSLPRTKPRRVHRSTA